MKKIFVTIIAALLTIAAAAQQGQFKPLDESAYESDKAYQAGNKYQKDAILFLDMLADTHPYYISQERRDELFTKKESLLKACAECSTDKEFTELLFGVLGRLHDKHTDLIDLESYAEMSQARAEAQAQASEENEAGHVMSMASDLFHYEIFPDHSICYLQFNQCADARTMGNETLPRFDVMLEEMFSDMRELAIQTLVVDAQYNGGGSSMLCDELLIHLKPYSEIEVFKTYIRFSDLMATFNANIATVKKNWEGDGHVDELYPMPTGKVSDAFVQPEVFQGNVVFVQSSKTYSSAGMLMTLARDNHIGTIIGSESSFPPSHYGEILPYSLPNTGVLGTICTKFFARPDTEHVDDESLIPDVLLDLSDKDATWQYIITHYGA